jgi:hypothetical protein
MKYNNVSDHNDELYGQIRNRKIINENNKDIKNKLFYLDYNDSGK